MYTWLSIHVYILKYRCIHNLVYIIKYTCIHNFLHVYIIILHVYIIKYTCIHNYLACIHNYLACIYNYVYMYTYLSVHMYTIKYTNNVYVHFEILQVTPQHYCWASYQIAEQVTTISLVALSGLRVLVLFWIMTSNRYNWQYSKSHNRYVLHNSESVFSSPLNNWVIFAKKVISVFNCAHCWWNIFFLWNWSTVLITHPWYVCIFLFSYLVFFIVLHIFWVLNTPHNLWSVLLSQ